METGQRRARPLSPPARRQAILDAVIPLLMERGASVTTADMAAAAGIAEGTIFRAFPDKAALIHEAIRTTVDPGPIRSAIEAIPESLPIEAQLERAGAILSGRFGQITALVGVLRSLPPTTEHSPVRSQRIATESMEAISDALAELFDRHRDRLSLDPARAAMAFQHLVFTNSHPLTATDKRLTIDEVVAIVLGGVLNTSETVDV